MTHFPDIVFINEEATGAINEAAIGAIKTPRNPLSCFFISCFTVSVPPSINSPYFSGDSIILIISSISSFETNKVNSVPALAAPFPLISYSNLADTDKVALVAY